PAGRRAHPGRAGAGPERRSRMRPRRNPLLPRGLDPAYRRHNEDAGRQAAPPPWPELVPLARVPGVPDFPVDVLPRALGAFVEAGAAALQCPADYVGVPLLALAGAAIWASRALEVKPGWTERPALYAAVVGPPGSAKTPALKLAAGPIYAEQARLHEIYRR